MDDNQLKERFSSLRNSEEKLDPRVWNRLSRRLSHGRKQRFQTQFNWAVAAALVVLFGIVATQIISTTKMETETAQRILPAEKDSIHSKDSLSLLP